MLPCSYCTCETCPFLAYGETIKSGTRIPSPSKSVHGGGTWSYQPPQSSQNTKIVVVSQNWLCPTALTMLATQSGPLLPLQPAQSDIAHVGVIQVTLASVPRATSFRNRVG